MSTFKYDDNSQLTSHFSIGEFRCKCGNKHDTVIDPLLAEKLEHLRTALKCKSIVINSGYRCSSHDKRVGGSGSGQHTMGRAADIVCYDKYGKKISSKKVCCAAQDVGFGGIANIDSTYTAVHVDIRSGKWYGDEVKGYNYSIPGGDFYKHYGLTKKDVYGEKTIRIDGLVIDGTTYAGTLTEKLNYAATAPSSRQAERDIGILKGLVPLAGQGQRPCGYGQSPFGVSRPRNNLK